MNNNIPTISVEDDNYIYYLDEGRIWSKRWKKLIGSYNRVNGYLHYSDANDNCRTKKVHRIIYEKAYGIIPVGIQVNHINRITDDNRLCNLNLMTPTQNSQWRGKNARNTSGEKNIFYNKKGKVYMVQLRVFGILKYYGSYKVLSDAIIKRNEIIKELNSLGHCFDF